MPTPTSLVMADGTFHLDAPLHVGPGTTLTIRNATVYFDARGCGSSVCEPPTVRLEGGTLRVSESRLDTTRGDMGWSLVGESARVEILDSVVANYSHISLQLAGEAPSRVERVTFRDAIGPLAFSRGAEADVVESRFEHVIAGVAVRDSSANVLRNAFHDVRGGRALDVQATLVGEKSFVTMPLVQGNLIEDSDVGMVSVNGFPNVVRDNVFRGNRLALHVYAFDGQDFVHTDAAVVEGNTFESNGVSLSMGVMGSRPTSGTRVLEAHGNAFLGDACPHVIARLRPNVEVRIHATDNWWGTAEGPATGTTGCPPVSGDSVTVAPWRTAWDAGEGSG